MKEIIVTGTLSFDYIMDFPGNFSDRIMPEKIHAISLSFLVDKLSKQFGGTAGNIAYSLNLLESNCHLLSVAGNDFEPYRIFLEKSGLSTAGVTQIRKLPSSCYFVITDKNDNQIGSFYLGATKFAHTVSIGEYLKKNSSIHNSYFVILAPTTPEAMLGYVGECQKLKLPYLFDPAFQIATFENEQLKSAITGAEILIGNDYEIALIEEKFEISHEELIVMVPVLVTTLGPKGSVIETRKESIHISPAKAKKVLDPTGAGDAYRSGFMAGYCRGYDLVTCGQIGSVAAVYTVEKYGTVTHSYTKAEFSQRFVENYGTTIIL